MQLYHLLSLYKVLKPPKFGNCRNVDSLQQQRPKMSFEDFKKAFAVNECKSFKKVHVENIQKKLDGYIQSDAWECDDIIEVNEEMSEEIIDCVIYYICGFICRKMLTKTKCDLCRKAFSSQRESATLPVAKLVNIKSKGGLIHPNTHLYKMFRAIETLFIKNINSENVYHNVINEIADKDVKLSFPCDTHKNDVISNCIHYYLTVRMRQFARLENKKKRNTSKKFKKQAKVVSY